MGSGRHRRRPRGTRARGQAGFTLVELLMAMALGVIVLTGGTLILARAFGTSTQASARTQSTGQAEAGFERLILDLRYAQHCPGYRGTNSLGVANQRVDGVLVSTGPTLQMCGPVPGTHSATPVPLALITWTCNTGSTSESCVRSTQAIQCGSAPATGDCSATAPTLAAQTLTAVPIAGVSALTVSGIVAGANQPSLLADAACQVSPGVTSYGLGAGATCPLSWIGLQAQVIPLLNAANPADVSNGFLTSRGVAATPVQTGTELENYGR